MPSNTHLPPVCPAPTDTHATDDQPLDAQRPPVPLEGIVYGEIAAWITVIGMVIACYGGVVGTWGLFLSMFRTKQVLLHRGGLYTVLAGIIGIILTLAATGIISPR